MKKFLLFAAAAVAMGASAQTLTQVWSTQQIPVGSVWGGDARQGVGVGGKYYINNAATQAVEVYGAQGLEKSIETGYGWSICADDAGNIISRAGTPGAGASLSTDSVQLNIVPADGSEVRKISLEGLDGLATARVDYFGHAYGDVVNGNGYLIVSQNGETQPYAIAFADGDVDPDNSFPMVVDAELMGFATQSTLGFSYVDADGAQHATLMVRNGGKFQDLTLNMEDGVLGEQVSEVADVVVNRGADAGGEIFKLGEKLYAVYPKKDVTGAFNYLDGFEIAELGSEEPVVVAEVDHTYTADQNKGAGNWTTVEPVDDCTVNIYHYYVNGFVAMYTFEVPQTAVNDINVAKEVKAYKTIENGQVVIVKGDAKYNVAGQAIK
ncbi:hypothetical protein [Sodaliphilus sp.]|uniref:hypothetical protein n=1 Tax=Sodaliphilus sp. TaxID=2815818 RepID=UPI00388FC6D0